MAVAPTAGTAVAAAGTGPMRAGSAGVMSVTPTAGTVAPATGGSPGTSMAGRGMTAGMGSPSAGSGMAAGGTGGAPKAGTSGSTEPMVSYVPIPDGPPGIGFDDMKYSPELKRLIVPAGRTGDVDLIDPLTNEVTRIPGFTKVATFTAGKHRNGSSAADYGAGKIFAIDNDTKSVKVIDPMAKMVVFSTTLKQAPDYVRWVESTQEIWVTMPQNPGVSVTNPEIEVLKITDGAAPMHVADISFATTGPEALFIDNKRNRGYTNNGFGGQTWSVDLKTRMIAETWKNGCTALTVDLEFDDERGFLMVACAAGRVAVLDTANGGKQLGEVMVGQGVDICAYNPMLHHMYVASQGSMDLSIVGISAAGMPKVLGVVPTTMGAQMVASDEYGNAWVVDPGMGRLIKVRDTYPATP